MKIKSWEYQQINKWAKVEMLALNGWRLVSACNGFYYMERELDDGENEEDSEEQE